MQSTLRAALEKISLEDLQRDEGSMEAWLDSLSTAPVRALD
jgi:hypothetical protein